MYMSTRAPSLWTGQRLHLEKTAGYKTVDVFAGEKSYNCFWASIQSHYMAGRHCRATRLTSELFRNTGKNSFEVSQHERQKLVVRAFINYVPYSGRHWR
jgi:hypothetical protein